MPRALSHPNGGPPPSVPGKGPATVRGLGSQRQSSRTLLRQPSLAWPQERRTPRKGSRDLALGLMGHPGQLTSDSSASGVSHGNPRLPPLTGSPHAAPRPPFRLQALLTLMLVKRQKETSEVSDQRIRVTSEVLTCIKLIKMYTWEKPFAHIITGTEQLLPARSLWLSWWATPPTFLTFPSCSAGCSVFCGGRSVADHGLLVENVPVANHGLFCVLWRMFPWPTTDFSVFHGGCSHG